jgi:hypothetical protein
LTLVTVQYVCAMLKAVRGKRSAWLQKLDEECPYQVVLPRRQLTDDNEIMNFLLLYAGKFDMYVEDECAAYVRYCFKDPITLRGEKRAV